MSSCCSATAAALEDSIPLETLKKIKDATVYIMVETTGRAGSGSGFVMKVDGNSALIVTNNHVIASEDHEGHSHGKSGSPRPRPPYGPRSSGIVPQVVMRPRDPEVTVVLHSGADG